MVDKNKVIPNHIAFVCDGNGRWAQARGKKRTYGHAAGEKVFESVVDALIKRGVSTITFYVFSTENWKRSKEEVGYLMERFEYGLKSQLKMAQKRDLRVRIIGTREGLSKKIVKLIENMEEKTVENTSGTICFALNYGGQDEIVRAAKDMARDAISGDVDLNSVDEGVFSTYLDSGDLLPIDLMVRTSQEIRISNFMLWSLAYAEMMFIKEYWPDMNEKIIDRVLREYAKRNRRFGKA